MKQTITYIVLCLLLSLVAVMPETVSAVEQESGPAAKLQSFGPLLVDQRVTKLKAYLASHDSPLTEYAHVFIREADKYELDWKLVAAIAGTESTFGEHIPRGSYNAWGWGIPTGAQSGIGFKNWEQGIATVSEGLAKNYYGRGAKTLYDVGWIYAQNGISWGNHVGFFLDKIEQFTPIDPDYLDVTI